MARTASARPATAATTSQRRRPKAPVYEVAAARFGERRHVGNLLHPNAFGYRVAAHALLFAALAHGLLPEGAVETDRLERGANAAVARIAREHVRRPARSE